jgi:ABC-2 type transport system ATP-binding protein
MIINEGKIAAQGTGEEIAQSMKGGENWSIILKGANAQSVRATVGNIGLNVDKAVADDVPGDLVRLEFFVPRAADDTGEKIFDWAVGRNLKILQMNRNRVTLEDIFVKLTKTAAGGNDNDTEVNKNE